MNGVPRIALEHREADQRVTESARRLSGTIVALGQSASEAARLLDSLDDDGAKRAARQLRRASRELHGAARKVLTIR